METIDLRPPHQMAIPGLSVFIAPRSVARLFLLHDYTKSPRFLQPQRTLFDTIEEKPPVVLYPVLRPNVLASPRYKQVTRKRRQP